MNMKTFTKKFSAAVLTAGLCAGSVFWAPSVSGIDQVRADEQVPSVYTNEPVPAALASQRPIAVMMPTDKAAQPSYGIGNAKVLYEVMRRATFPVSWLSLMTGRASAVSEISEAAVITIFPLPQSGIPF